MSVQKRGRSPCWEIQFSDPSPLRSIVECVQHVVSRVTFKITRQDESSPYFLKVDTADVAYVSCISVRYLVENIVNPSGEEIKFCLDCKHVVSCLINIRNDHTLVLEGHFDQLTPKVVIRTRDPDQPSHETCTELDTYVDTDNMQLFPMDFRMMLEIDLVMLRGLLKQAQVAKAERICLKIFTKEDPGRTISYTHFSVQGEFKHSSSFCHEVKVDDDGSMIVRAATDSMHSLFDTDSMNPIYEGIFPVDKIAGFVKALQCRMVVAKIKQNMPIMFQYMIGGTSDDVSIIRFLIAPASSETD